MLTIKVLTRQDVGRTANYYSDGADDYYAKEGNAKEWQGRGAKGLGLSGEVDPERFKELLAGQVNDHVQVNRGAIRAAAKDRIGLDLTFSAPKSVSIQALIAGDARLIQAHDKAVTAALQLAETMAMVRKKERGKTSVEISGNLIVAKFRHETSRDRDPQLHTHAVVMNLTKRSDGAWRALKNDEIVKSLRQLGAVYRAELALEIQALGFEIRHERDGAFELAHIGRDKIAAFSKRATAIETVLANKGLTREQATGAQKQAATMKTRQAKSVTNRDEIFADWQARAKELRIEFGSRAWDGAGRQPETASRAARDLPEKAAVRAVRYAIDHLTERQSVMGHKELMDAAMKQGIGRVRASHIEAEIKRQSRTGFLLAEDIRYRPAAETDAYSALSSANWIKRLTGQGLSRDQARQHVEQGITAGRLIAAEKRYTTQTAREREKRILKIEQQGREAVPAILAIERARVKLASSTLNEGQTAAALLLASTKNRVIGVQGFAGVGKSHMLEAAKDLVEGEGHKVRALAPYGSQVKTLRELGVEAKTLASFLRAKEKNLDQKTVLVIDEAGVVPTRQMEQVLRLAEQAGARVVLMGDKEQTKAIEAGRPFDQLQEAGMATAHMTEIQRQRDPILKAAVQLAARGQAAQSLHHLGSVTEIAEPATRREKLVADFMTLSVSERECTLILAGTNEARQDINRRVREAVGTAGQGTLFETLRRRDSTQVERRFSKNYHVGDVVQPEKDYKNGLNRGELYRVIDTGPTNHLTVEAQGKRITFSPLRAKLSVYQLEQTELSREDSVRITRNDAALNLATGERFKVIALETGNLVLEGQGRVVRLPVGKPLHIDHAYATTVHSAQGLTADRVLFEADAMSKTTKKDVFYVAISRARHEARIYTNDAKKLPFSIERESIKMAALDLERRGKAERAWQFSNFGNTEK